MSESASSSSASASAPAAAAPAPASGAATGKSATIRKQVEFYFSDANFRRDRFLRDEAAKDPQGFVPISTLLRFNRLKAMTTDESEVARAMLESTSVQISEDQKALRRSKPLPARDDSNERTVYLKGFPTTATLDQLLAWFEKVSNGKTERVLMRRTGDKSRSFKGSVFAEFGSVEDAKAFVAASEKEPLAYDDDSKITEVLMRGDYFAKKRSDRESRIAKEQAELDAELFKDFQQKKVPGSIIRIKGLPSHVQWPDMQQAASRVVKVRFTELSEDDTTAAFMRLSSSDDAQALLKALQTLKEAKGKADEAKEGEEKKEGESEGLSEVQMELLAGFGGAAPEAEVLAGEEEDAYWEKVFVAYKERIRQQAQRNNRKRGRGQQKSPRPSGGAGASSGAASGAGESGGGDAVSGEEPAAKKAKVEESS